MTLREVPCPGPRRTDPMGVTLGSEKGTFHALAPAKLNIELRVGEELEGGYHSLEGIMQTVIGKELCDGVTFRLLGGELRNFGIVVFADGLEDTIVTAALGRLQETVGPLSGEVHISRNIPASAGLGGSSSGAAAALRVVNYACDLGLSKEKLQELSLPVGNDIPFLIQGGRARVVMEGCKACYISAPLPSRETHYVIVNDSSSPLSTRAMYRNLDIRRRYGLPGESSERNDFAELAFDQSPNSRALLDVMRREGSPIESGLTGKGPAVYAGYASCEEADAVRLAVKAQREEWMRVYRAVSSDAFG